LQLQDSTLHFIGDKDAVLFRCEEDKLPQKKRIVKSEELSWLLRKSTP
jgi:hypothetical protein